jgi:hypothetical protein
MRTVQELYDRYKIMPSLQLHQLRVGAVAKKIVDNLEEPLDKEAVVTACLFHDMGNIIKSDLERFPDFLEPEGLEYWEVVKKEYIDKYGSDDHSATEKIAREIGFSPNIMFCLTNIGISRAADTAAGDSLERKICSYADMRVGPYGVLPMEERIADLRKRYAHKYHVIATDKFEACLQGLRDIEQQISRKVNITLEQITDEEIKDILEELRGLEV